MMIIFLVLLIIKTKSEIFSPDPYIKQIERSRKTCQKGPYLIFVPNLNDGFGSMMNYYKFPLLVAKFLNMTMVPTSHYFVNKAPHYTDYLYTSGFGLDLECTAEDIEARSSVQIIDGVYSKDPTLQDIYVTFGLCGEHNNTTLLQLNKTDTGIITTLQNILNIPEIKSMQSRLVLRVLDMINIKFFPYGQKRIETMERSAICTRHIFIEKFQKRYALDVLLNNKRLARTLKSFDKEFIIAWHFRWGDSATKSLDVTPRYAMPYNKAVQYLSMILFHKDSVLLNVPLKRIKIKFIVECPAKEAKIIFKNVTQLFHGRTKITAGTGPKSDYFSFDLLATSDILISGVSNYARVAATCNNKGVIIADIIDKYRNIYNVYEVYYKGYDNLLFVNSSIHSFNTLLCRQLRKYHRNKLLQMSSCIPNGY